MLRTNNKLFTTTYDALNVDVEAMFKNQCNPQSQEREEYNSFNYWSKNDSYYMNLEELTDLDKNESDLEKNKSKKQEEEVKKVNDEQNEKKDDGKETSIKILSYLYVMFNYVIFMIFTIFLSISK